MVPAAVAISSPTPRVRGAFPKTRFENRETSADHAHNGHSDQIGIGLQRNGESPRDGVHEQIETPTSSGGLADQH